jgi:hypothetical protein
MSTISRAVGRPEEPVRAASDEHATAPSDGRVRRVARVRVPIALGCCPWANAYRLPNGTTVWCLRLWQNGRLERVVVSTPTLRAYAVRSGLRSLVAAIDQATDPARA